MSREEGSISSRSASNKSYPCPVQSHRIRIFSALLRCNWPEIESNEKNTLIIKNFKEGAQKVNFTTYYFQNVLDKRYEITSYEPILIEVNNTHNKWIQSYKIKNKSNENILVNSLIYDYAKLDNFNLYKLEIDSNNFDHISEHSGKVDLINWEIKPNHEITILIESIKG